MSGILTVDIGNTVTALALWQGTDSPHHWQLASTNRSADELRILFTRLLEARGLAPDAVGGCALGSVVPSLTPAVAEACEALLGRTPLVVGPGVPTGLRIRTDDPRDVGADRIANAVAARARWGQPVMVLDFGTAFTIDVVDGGGDYIGAVIAPGLAVAAEALHRRAARLPQVPLEAPRRAIAQTTVEGMQSGLVLGFVGLVEGLVRRVWAAIGKAPVVATGEAPWAAVVLPWIGVVDAYEPLLTLDGLRRIYELPSRRA